MDNILTTLQLKVLLAQKSKLDTTWNRLEVNSPVYKLYFISKGQGFVINCGKTYPLRPGHLYLIPPQPYLEYGCKKQIEIYWTHFEAKLFLNQNLCDLISPSTLEVKCRNYKLMVSWFREISKGHKSRNIGEIMVAKARILNLLARFYNQNESVNEQTSKIMRFQPVIQYLEENLGKKMTVAELAKKACLERAYFTTLFTETYGLPPHQYLNRRRIEKARYLIMNSTDKFEHIARQLGFTDGFHFSKVFKEITGITPSEFRKNKIALTP